MASHMYYNSDCLVFKVLQSSNETLLLESQTFNSSCNFHADSFHDNRNYKIKLQASINLVKVNTVSPVYDKFSGQNRIHDKYVSESLHTFTTNLTCRFEAKGQQKSTHQNGKMYFVKDDDIACNEMAEYNIFENAVLFKLK